MILAGLSTTPRRALPPPHRQTYAGVGLVYGLIPK